LPEGAQETLRDGLAHALHSNGGSQLSTAGSVVALVAGPVILLGGALIVLPLFGLARRVGRPDLALPLAALGALTPGLLHFVGTYDVVFATAAAALFYLAVRGLTSERRHGAWGIAAGLLLAAMTYVSFTHALP